MSKSVFSFTWILMLSLALAGFVLPGKEPPKKRKFIDRANMDLSVKPGDNFYEYANGRWVAQNPVPASKTRWGSFDMLREQSARQLQKLLEDAAQKAAKEPRMQQIGDFYTSGMDSAHLEKMGMQPIQPLLQRIQKIATPQDFMNETIYLRSRGIGALYGFSIGQDRKNVTAYIPQFSQGGTTLPDRDYYLKNDARSATIRTAYQKHLVKMFQLAGNNEQVAAQKANAILRIETALAKIQMSRVEMRDPYKTYHKYAVADFSATTPGLDWKLILTGLQVPKADSVIVNNPTFFSTVNILLTALPVDDWKTYLQWQVLSFAAPYLNNAFAKENFSFTRVLTGQQVQTPRNQRISGLIDNKMGDLLGRLYVDAYFKPEAKKRMLELVNNLQETFASRIQSLDWMSAATKEKALEKLHAFTKKIGYPDKWKDYSSIIIKKDDLLGNIIRCNEWSYQDMIERYGQPVDKTRWGMTPPTINAYYNPTNNEIAFPAGILQFPFFDFEADDAINYGGIGAVIGHEMTHGFDDQGRQYAADGNLLDWWTKEDAGQFGQRADQVVAQYNGYIVEDSLHVNGRLTLGENLADLGGLNIAYEAFTHTQQFKDGKKIDGFTPAQRFFLSWAQVWRSNTTPERAAQMILTDPHSPGIYRTNGPVSNIDAWYQAFNVQPGEALYKAPDARIKVW